MTKKYIARTTGEWSQPLHNGDDVPLTFDTPEAAFHAGQNMNGVAINNDAFIVREYVDEDDDDYEEQFYPIFVGHNGAQWVRHYYMKILFDILNGATNKAEYRNNLWAIPDCDPFKAKLAELLEVYLDSKP